MDVVAFLDDVALSGERIAHLGRDRGNGAVNNLLGDRLLAIRVPIPNVCRYIRIEKSTSFSPKRACAKSNS